MTAGARERRRPAAQDAAFIRQALRPPPRSSPRPRTAGGPGYQALQEAALDVPGGGRPLAGVHYDVCLAVDHLDFPRPVRGAR